MVAMAAHESCVKLSLLIYMHATSSFSLSLLTDTLNIHSTDDPLHSILCSRLTSLTAYVIAQP